MASPDQTSQQTRNEEENDIHNAKRKARLKHGACLIDLHTHPINIRIAQRTEIDIVRGASGDSRAVGVGDEAQLIDTGDEGAHKTEIDEGDEEGIGARAVVGEERGDGPGGGEDADDEENEDVVGCEGVVGVVYVDEVGEHA